ncbi:MAG: ATP-binding protein [Bacillota bacterium]
MPEREAIGRGVEEFGEYVRRRRWEFERLTAERQAVEEKLAEVRAKEAVLTQAREVFQLAAETAREQAKQSVERVVTWALQAVFGPEISFAISLEERRDQPEADFVVVSTYGGTTPVRTEPMEARGGGIVDVISLALRGVLLERTRMGGPLVLDEPGKHVSEEYSRALGEFIRAISEGTGRQVILVTHNSELAETAEVAYRVELKNGESYVYPVGSSPPHRS